MSVDNGVKECPICTETIGDAIITTNCGHSYCYDCFMTHFCGDLSNANSCPMCRSTLFKEKPKYQRKPREQSRNIEQSRHHMRREPNPNSDQPMMFPSDHMPNQFLNQFQDINRQIIRNSGYELPEPMINNSNYQEVLAILHNGRLQRTGLN
jgi:hypothetical protein